MSGTDTLKQEKDKNPVKENSSSSQPIAKLSDKFTSISSFISTPGFHDAAIQTVLIMQRHVVTQQLSKLNEYQQKFQLLPQKETIEFPDLLLRRSNAQNSYSVPNSVQHFSKGYGVYGTPGRLVSNEEVAIMDILDADGMITTAARMTEFMVFMTRVQKMEHRILCMHILCKRTSPSCGIMFVKNSGLKLLRRWLKFAEEDGRVDELRFIVAACKSLPFNAEAVKYSEIGKAIKKLLKYKQTPGVSAGNVNMLYEEVKDLMKQWTEKIESSASNDPSSSDANATANAPKDIVISSKINDTSKSGSDIMKLLLSHSSQSKSKLSQESTSSIESKESDSHSKSATKSDDKRKKDSSSSSSSSVAAAAAPEPTTLAARLMAATNAQSNSTTTTTTSSTSRDAKQSGSASVSISVKPVAIERQTSQTQGSAQPLSWLQSISSKPAGGLGQSLADNLSSSAAATAAATTSAAPRERKNDVMIEEAKKRLAMRETQESDNTDTISLPLADVRPLGKSNLKRKNDGTSTNTAKRVKLSVNWADDAEKDLTEVFLFEVDKIRSSVSTYKSHKDLVKKEKQLEKDLYTQKVNDTMIKTTNWREPALLPLSIDILDTLNAPVTSNEKAIQERRITNIIETRFLDDSLIPNDPDALPSAYSSDPSYQATESVVNIPWLSSSEQERNDYMIDASSGQSNQLPILVTNLDPELYRILAQNEGYLAYVLRSDGITVDPEKLQHVQSMLSNVMNPVASSERNYGMTSSTPTAYGWQPSYHTVPGTAPAMNVYGVPPPPPPPPSSSINAMIPPPPSNPSSSSSFSFAVPSLSDLTTNPSATNNNNMKGNKLLTCRLYNSPEGCRFGDKCEFSHELLPSSSTATMNAMRKGPGVVVKPKSGPGHRVGPGGRMG